MRTIIKFNEKKYRLAVEIVDPAVAVTTPVAECSVKNFNKAFNQMMKASDRSIIPAAIRWMSPSNDIIVWERPPHYVSFQFSLAKQYQVKADSDPKFKMRIPLPWQYYIVSLTPTNKIANIFMFFGSESLQSFNASPLYHAPILNFYSDGRLCQAAYDDVQEYDASFTEILNTVYTMIWYSGFNLDLLSNLATIGRGHILYQWRENVELLYKRWSALTIEQIVNQPLGLAWNSLRDFIQSGVIRDQDTNMTTAEDISIALAMAAQDAESMV